MKHQHTFLITGIWLFILPFLGFPQGWKNFLMIITGLVLMIMYVVSRLKHTEVVQVRKEVVAEIFVENSDINNNV